MKSAGPGDQRDRREAGHPLLGPGFIPSGGMIASLTELRNGEEANFVEKKVRSVFNMGIWWNQWNFQVETPSRQLENLVCGSGERFGNLKAVD